MATETPEKPQDMRLRMLRTVEATHQHGTAAAAAQALHVSTSAVSRTTTLVQMGKACAPMAATVEMSAPRPEAPVGSLALKHSTQAGAPLSCSRGA